MATSNTTIMVDVNAASEHTSRLNGVKDLLLEARSIIDPSKITESDISGNVGDALHNATRAAYDKIQKDLEPAIDNIIQQILNAVKEYQRADRGLGKYQDIGIKIPTRR